MATLAEKNEPVEDISEEDLDALNDAISELSLTMSFQGSQENIAKISRMCQGCKKDIQNKEDYLTAKGKIYHTSCLSCCKCACQFGSEKPFIPVDMDFYCEACHLETFGKKCAGCDEYITDQIITALDKDWHVKCFVCEHCKEPFSEKANGSYIMHNEKPYCPDDYRKLFGKRCAACDDMLEGSAIKVDDLLYHPACLTCETCKVPFKAGKFYLAGGKRYCQEHLPRTARPTCEACKKDITGTYIRLQDGTNMHTECHVCLTCQVILDGTYTTFNGGSYCMQHGKEMADAAANSQTSGNKTAISITQESVSMESMEEKKRSTDVPSAVTEEQENPGDVASPEKPNEAVVEEPTEGTVHATEAPSEVTEEQANPGDGASPEKPNEAVVEEATEGAVHATEEQANPGDVASPEMPNEAVVEEPASPTGTIEGTEQQTNSASVETLVGSEAGETTMIKTQSLQSLIQQQRMVRQHSGKSRSSVNSVEVDNIMKTNSVL